jgi:S-adenosylmethionine synthetase
MPKFGGGKIVEPIKIIIAGRATSKIGDRLVPVTEIAVEAAENYIEKNLHAVDGDHIQISADIKQGAGNLQEVFKKTKQIPLANDTSFGVAFAPYSETEKIVLKTADMINSEQLRKKYPAVGEDIKVMAFRNGDKIRLTCAIAFIDKYISSMQEYYEIKAKVAEEIKQNLKSITKKQVDDIVNTLDASNGKSIDDVYLTVTGLSAEMGDDGQVGRGNRASGLITPCRPMSLEAPCGKNPISHTGKIYNVLAQQIANDIIKQNAAKECYVKILSQIGKPIDNPFVCSVQVDDLSREKEAMQIVDNWLANITNITELIINEKVRLY